MDNILDSLSVKAERYDSKIMNDILNEQLRKKRKRKQLVQRILLIRAKTKKAVFHDEIQTIWTLPKGK